MANISLNRLYELFMSEENPIVCDNMLKSYVDFCSEDSGVLFEAKEYVQKNLGAIPNFFKSTENSEFENKGLKNLRKVFQNLAYAVDNYLSDVRSEVVEKLKQEDDETEKYISDLYEDAKIIEPQHLFSISPERIKAAYKAYYSQIDNIPPQAVAEVIALIKRVQDDGVLDKLFASNGYENVTIDDLLFSLYDYYNKNDETFKTSFEDLYPDDDSFYVRNYFNNIKNGEVVGEIEFKKYRPSLISKRGFNTDLNKMVFARNLLSYKKSGIMPSPNGLIDFYVGEEEEDDLTNRLCCEYSKRFDNDKFKSMQSSPIFIIENSLVKPERLEKMKGVRKGKGLALGALLSSPCSVVNEFVRQFYLIHIYIDDVTDDKCKYEIQLNIIPEARFDARIQLMRLDNWKDLQSHKNIGYKLQTTTHVHLYNHLDLLRGKTDGAYDIAYNFNEDSTKFDDSLKAFLKMMGADPALEANLYKKIMKAKDDVQKYIEREM